MKVNFVLVTSKRASLRVFSNYTSSLPCKDQFGKTLSLLNPLLLWATVKEGKSKKIKKAVLNKLIRLINLIKKL